MAREGESKKSCGSELCGHSPQATGPGRDKIFSEAGRKAQWLRKAEWLDESTADNRLSHPRLIPSDSLTQSRNQNHSGIANIPGSKVQSRDYPLQIAENPAAQTHSAGGDGYIANESVPDDRFAVTDIGKRTFGTFRAADFESGSAPMTEVDDPAESGVSPAAPYYQMKASRDSVASTSQRLFSVPADIMSEPDLRERFAGQFQGAQSAGRMTSSAVIDHPVQRGMTEFAATHNGQTEEKVSQAASRYHPAAGALEDADLYPAAGAEFQSPLQQSADVGESFARPGMADPSQRNVSPHTMDVSRAGINTPDVRMAAENPDHAGFHEMFADNRVESLENGIEDTDTPVSYRWKKTIYFILGGIFVALLFICGMLSFSYWSVRPVPLYESVREDQMDTGAGKAESTGDSVSDLTIQNMEATPATRARNARVVAAGNQSIDYLRGATAAAFLGADRAAALTDEGTHAEIVATVKSILTAELQLLRQEQQTLFLEAQNALSALETALGDSQLKQLPQLQTQLEKLTGLLQSRVSDHTAQLPQFNAVAIKLLGDEVWVSIVDGDGKRHLLRRGDEFQGWRLMTADSASRTTVFRNRSGRQFRSVL